MTSRTGLLSIASILGATLTASAQVSPNSVTVVIETGAGAIEIFVDSLNAPVTVGNFLRYVDAGLFEGGTFYRVVRADNQPDDSIRIAVIQGGMDSARQAEAFEPIRLEGTNETGIEHLDGTISMARAGPHTARAEFFICVGDQPELDAGGRRNPDGLGFAAFGRVTDGMEVVRRIHAVATEGQRLIVPVQIERVTRLHRPYDDEVVNPTSQYRG